MIPPCSAAEAVHDVVHTCDEYLRATLARDEIEDATSLAWRVAHSVVRGAAAARACAFRRAWGLGALPYPRWAGVSR